MALPLAALPRRHPRPSRRRFAVVSSLPGVSNMALGRRGVQPRREGQEPSGADPHVRWSCSAAGWMWQPGLAYRVPGEPIGRFLPR